MFGMRVFLSALLINFISVLAAQDYLAGLQKSEIKRFNKISQKSRRAPSAITTSVANLSNYLTTNTQTDLEKVRSIYVWVANNIAYDMKGYIKNSYPPQDPETVLKSRTAICQGYSNLVQALCSETDIKSIIIVGYSKGFGYDKGKEFEVSDHAWNAVKIEGEWYLLDATWAATKNNMPDKFLSPSDIERYFLPNPLIFIDDHLPADPLWQFNSNPVPLSVFETGSTEIRSHFNQDQNNFNFKDSLKTWENLSLGDQHIQTYKRSSNFNPRNKRAKSQLGVSILFKALDSMNNVHSINYEEFDNKFDDLEKVVYSLLDEAAFHLASVPETSESYKLTQEFLEEVTYQKGVYKYEVGQRIQQVVMKMQEREMDADYLSLANMINSSYDEAILYFNLVSSESRYFDDAQEYTNYYIPEFRPQVN